MSTGKVCTRCKRSKLLDQFYSSQLGKLGRASQCKDCVNQATRDRYHQNVLDPVKRKQIQATQAAKYRRRSLEEKERYQRRSNIGRYGFTTESLKAHLERIGNCCEICGRSLEGYRNRHIDHDQARTRKDVRGILCRACNHNLGYLRTIADGNEMKALQSFLAYLDWFEQRA